MEHKAMAGRLREIANELDEPSQTECSGDITSECEFKPQQLTLGTGKWWYLEISYKGNSVASQQVLCGDWKCEEGYEIITRSALFKIEKTGDC